VITVCVMLLSRKSTLLQIWFCGAVGGCLVSGRLQFTAGEQTKLSFALSAAVVRATNRIPNNHTKTYCHQHYHDYQYQYLIYDQQSCLYH